MKSRNLLISLGLGVTVALILLWALGSGSALVTAAPSAEWRVCAAGSPACTHTTVQAAVDAASDGDVIKVATGVYTGVLARGDNITQVVYVSKTVTIQGGYTDTNWETSNPNANPTTLDAQGQGRVFYIAGVPALGAGISPTIEGLRITGGDATDLGGGSGGWDAGGGLYIVDAEAIISHNLVFSNTAYGGGGLYLFDSAAALDGNTIESNVANDEGGGMYLFNSDAVLSDNAIEFNTASDGAGLYLHYSDATLNSNAINGNFAREGGGLYLRASDAALSGNTIHSNIASDDGGGLFLDLGSDATLDQNRIISNTAYSGGGLFLWSSNPTLHGNIVMANSAQLGGGLFVRESDARLDNNVVVRNRAANQGSGLYVAGSSLRLRHSTIAQNNDGDGTGIYVTDYGPYYSTVALTNTILVSHTTGVFVAAGNTASLEATLWGTGVWANTNDWSGAGTVLAGSVSIHGDPAFVGLDDYHILTDSAAKDAGIDAGLNSDMDWDLRPIDGDYDIGADEFPVIAMVSPGAATTLVYMDPQNNPTSLSIPNNAVTGTSTITIVYTPKAPQNALPAPEGMALGSHIFDLDVYQDGALVPHFSFARAVTLTSEYSDADIAGIEEDGLALYRETEGEWVKIGARTGETQTLDVENNLLTVYLLGTSQFGEAGPVTGPRFIFMPLIIKNGGSGTMLPSF
ncbi:MAG: hypothetical protein GY832_22885 [Chloroflexi bacterium]|nr:hypothetical protein [Chloroflexota bacterium]